MHAISITINVPRLITIPQYPHDISHTLAHVTRVLREVVTEVIVPVELLGVVWNQGLLAARQTVSNRPCTKMAWHEKGPVW